MRLERLEISGFKSFSDRSELSFDEGVTAIVGPNGCGKSNVADAITWVLGEQSAKSLRGEKMEDVIFNGSRCAQADRRRRGAPAAQRRPSPAAAGPTRDGATKPARRQERPATFAIYGGIARRTREVEVTRRLYRSGESEYLIDGQHCRLGTSTNC
jgi:chromosome segregation protein